MKLEQPRENHPFDLITHHLSEIARQLARQRMRKEPQAHVTYLALKSKVSFYIWMNSSAPTGILNQNLLICS
jgi:hypothetical protein